jgi:predicted Zn finger-like uncharacterized protein
MKFQCDRCQTRYSIGEEKIRGKVLKIRCKNCSAVITVREGNASTTGPEAEAKADSKSTGSQKAIGGAAARDKGSTIGKAPTADKPNAPANGTGRKDAGKAPVLEAAFDRAMARPSAAMPAVPGGDRNATALEDESASTKMGPPPEPAADIEWFVSIDGEQEGPFTLPEARKRVGKKKADEEMFAWQEGFDDWLSVDKVPELAPHLPSAKPARGAPAIPGDAGKGQAQVKKGSAPLFPVAAKGPSAAPAPVAEESPFSLAALASSGASPSGSTSDDDDGDPNADPSNDNFDFDIGEASRVVKLPMLVPPPRGDAATPAPTRRTAAVNLPGMAQARGTGGQAIVGANMLGPDANPAAQILAPRPRKKHGMFFFAGIGVLVAIVGALVFVLMQTSKPSEFASGEGAGYRTDRLFADLYAGNADPVAAKKIEDLVTPVLQPGKKPKQPKVTAEPKAPTPAVGKREYEEFGSGGQAGGPRNAEDILDMQRSQGGALKQCWERALKTNPDLKARGGVRLNVNMTVKADGSLKNVNIASATADSTLKKCVTNQVASWRLKTASNDLAMEFPIVFQ